MSKLTYPLDGLHGNCKTDFEAATDALSAATTNAAFDLPASLPDRSFLATLPSTLRNYLNETGSIAARLRALDQDYQSLASDFEANVRALPTTKIPTREPLIV